MNLKGICTFLFLNILCFTIFGQEGVKAISGSKINPQASKVTIDKSTSLSLPFFDDFTSADGRPDINLWKENSGVYINNHYVQNIISRGVATFDANDYYGTPYDTINNDVRLAADSLVSQNIDLSSYSDADNVFFSLYYQAGGLGYIPKQSDSLIIYFKNDSNKWEQKISIPPIENIDTFTKLILRIEETRFFHSEFAIKIMNYATKGISNSHWHIDYIQLDANRTPSQPLNDIAFTRTANSILQGYNSMPYKHFSNNKSKYFNNNFSYFIRNNSNSNQTVNVQYNAKVSDGSNLGSGNQNITLSPNTEQIQTINLYNATVHNPANIEDSFYYNHVFKFTDQISGRIDGNDSITFTQAFENYYAYDDGTAEKAYYINMHPSYNIPALNAIQFDFEIADSLRGVAIYFTKEVPSQKDKEFAIRIYKNIAINGGQDELVHEEEFLYPIFIDTINEFALYKFEKPVYVTNGTYYVTIVQLAGGFSDSLFIGLDVHYTQPNNHRYINVAGTWEPSTIDGALMVRPLVGNHFDIISNTDILLPKYIIYPNPATKSLILELPNTEIYQYTIWNNIGQQVLMGKTSNQQAIEIESLQTGQYILQLKSSKGSTLPITKFIKLD